MPHPEYKIISIYLLEVQLIEYLCFLLYIVILCYVQITNKFALREHLGVVWCSS